MGQIPQPDVADLAGPVDTAQDVGDADRLGRTGQFVAAVPAAVASHQSVGAQIGKDIDEELRGNALGGGEVVGLDYYARLDRSQLESWRERRILLSPTSA